MLLPLWLGVYVMSMLHREYKTTVGGLGGHVDSALAERSVQTKLRIEEVYFLINLETPRHDYAK